MRRVPFPFLLLVVLLAVASTARGQAMTREELEAWFDDDTSARIAQVNEGELVFLRQPPAKPVHHHHNVLTVDDAAVTSGWAELRQCHFHLDRVPATQIVFHPDRVRALEIVSRQGIGQAWVEGATVQLREVGPHARICLRLMTQALLRNADGTYHVNSGPFMRRFLDGYYPMHVTMEVRLLTRRLRFLDITPPGQEGFQVTVGPDRVSFDGWFEGRLQTLIRFVPLGRSRPPPG